MRGGAIPMKKETIVLARDDGYLWSQAILIFSLDIAAMLSTELGTGEFLSDNLRQMAREYSREHLLVSERSTDLIVCEFAARVESELGKNIIKQIQAWMKTAYPNHSTTCCYWIWSILFMRLCQSWDDHEYERRPLSEPASVCARIDVRDYISHLSNFSDELELTLERSMSEWDAGVAKHCNEWFNVPSNIRGIHDSIAARSFWIKLYSKLTDGDLKELEEWGCTYGKGEKMPLRYIRLPKIR